MRIMVTGVGGQLGSNIAFNLIEKFNGCSVIGVYNNTPVYGDGRLELVHLDLGDRNEVRKEISKWQPDIIIHCAALTNVDYCERRPTEAFRINTLATRNIAEAALDKTIIYISTDNVYRGGDNIYKEDDELNPINNYGLSKLAGEESVRLLCDSHLIIRTNFFGWDNRITTNSFLERIIRTLHRNEPVHLFRDVEFCPISIPILFSSISELLVREKWGTFNVVGPLISKASFGELICDEFGYDKNNIVPISIDDVHLDARRAKRMHLDNSKIQQFSERVSTSTKDQLAEMKKDYELGYKMRMRGVIRVES